MENLISITNLGYRPESFPEDKPDILRDVSMDIDKGAFIAIIGRNGSGKTTLIKHINGLLLPSSGKVSVAGLDTKLLTNHAKLRSIVGMVFQNPADQIVASTVEEDVAFGLENLNLPSVEIKKCVYEQLEMADLLDEAQRPPHLLSGGQVQRLALAGVLARKPKVILFDEPTSMLDPLTRTAFLERIKNLHSQGITIITITHHMEEAALAERIYVMDQGKLIMTGTPHEIFAKDQDLYEVGLEIPESAQYAKGFKRLGFSLPNDILTQDDLLQALPPYSDHQKPITHQAVEKCVSDTIIDAQRLHYTYLAGTPLAKKALNGATLAASRGQIHGIAGSNGSGKSTLLQHFNGILRPEKGKIRVGDLTVENPKTSLRDVVKQVGLVFQNPETQFFETYVGDEIAFGPKQFEMDHLKERVQQAMAQVGLDFDLFKDRRMETLSGGEKRKVAIASTLILDQEILLFDEPTAGMDPQSRDDLLLLFSQLQNKGKTILIASHRLDEIAKTTQDLSVMKSGKVLKTSTTQELLFDDKIIDKASLSAPLIIQIEQNLIEKGWPIQGCHCMSFKQLETAIGVIIK